MVACVDKPQHAARHTPRTNVGEVARLRTGISRASMQVTTDTAFVIAKGSGLSKVLLLQPVSGKAIHRDGRMLSNARYITLPVKAVSARYTATKSTPAVSALELLVMFQKLLQGRSWKTGDGRHIGIVGPCANVKLGKL